MKFLSQKITFFVTVTLFATIIFYANNIKVFAENFASPIAPAGPERSKIIGGLLGFGQNMQNGTAYVDCPECEFQDGSGFGATVGMNYEEQLSADDRTIFYHFYLGGLLHWSSKDFAASYREKTAQYFANYDVNFPLTFRHSYSAWISTTGLMPYIKFVPFKFFFLQFGFDAAYVVANTMKHEIELLDRRKTLPNGEIVDIFIPTNNPNRKLYSQTLQNEEIKEVNKFQMALIPALGFNIFVTDRFSISPSFNYHIALNKISNYDDYKVNSWRLNLEFKYNLSDPNKFFPTVNPTVKK